ncbi:MAG TPA: response regulator [Chitinispirillaceae bacterium]|nr:response regulator [Chitinispirillaceae bacterium]
MNKPVLVIDDDISLCESVGFTLEVAGITPVATCDGFNKAQSYIEQGVDLILLDITMPEINGVVALSTILSDHPRLPVVMLTGDNQAQTAVSCMKAGARDYLVKPINDEKLIQTVREYLPSPIRRFCTREELLCWNKQINEELLKADDPLCKKFAYALIEKELFRNPELSIQMLAREIQSNQKTVSSMVNEYCGMNFRSLLNRLRIAAFIRNTVSCQKLSLDGQCQKVGFQRYATFSEACRNVMGILPRELI